MRIGRYDVHAINAGDFALDGGAMFGVVPRPLWERVTPPDDRNRIAMTTRSLLIIGDNRRILVDTGNGAKFDKKLVDIYKMDVSPGTMDQALARFGLTPGDITDVILTHLHFDHAGGATIRTSEGIAPAFARARYYVQKDQWRAANRPTDRDRASYYTDDFLPLEQHGVLELLDGEGELFPGVALRLFHGHTSALQCPVLTGEGKTLLFCADLIPLAPHLQLPWIMGYDLRPLVTLEEKRGVLEQAVEERWMLFLEHDPSVEVVTVRRGNKGVEKDEILPVE
jgi:glyoxylase-like metal-dependent hydrolase (beta-lactamase superfamily II)